MRWREWRFIPGGSKRKAARLRLQALGNRSMTSAHLDPGDRDRIFRSRRTKRA